MKNCDLSSSTTKSTSCLHSLSSLISIILLWLFAGNVLYAQGLLINEISNRAGNEEYVELLVWGGTDPISAGCPPCLDLRGWIIDDNDGTFATGMGTGIAQGAIRFANDPQWECVPYGTLIVVYNEGQDENNILTKLPIGDDLSDSNDDCVYVLPGDSDFFEGSRTVPSVSSPGYAGAVWNTMDADWNPGDLNASAIMGNLNDSYQTRSSDINSPYTAAATPYHAVNWGNNLTNTIIYIGGDVDEEVVYMDNSADDDPFNPANWTRGDAGVYPDDTPPTPPTPGDETPGLPNSPANAAWIASMSSCGYEPPDFDDITPNDCAPGGGGSFVIEISGGAENFAFSWKNIDDGSTFSSPAVWPAGMPITISNLTPGDYDITITDAFGCQIVESETINSGLLVSTSSASPMNNSQNCGENNGIVEVTGITGGDSNYPCRTTSDYCKIWHREAMRLRLLTV